MHRAYKRYKKINKILRFKSAQQLGWHSSLFFYPTQEPFAHISLSHHQGSGFFPLAASIPEMPPDIMRDFRHYYALRLNAFSQKTFQVFKYCVCANRAYSNLVQGFYRFLQYQDLLQRSTKFAMFENSQHQNGLQIHNSVVVAK